MAKSANKNNILDKAVDLFFPGNTSALGDSSLFKFNVLYFQQNEMPNDITVEEMFNTTGLTVLKFYLSSKLKNPVTSTITSSDVQCK